MLTTMKRLPLLSITLVVLALISVAVARAGSSASYTTPTNTVASGGQLSTSANYAIASTLGQPAIGQGQTLSYALCSGFWCQAWSAPARLFLPLVGR